MSKGKFRRQKTVNLRRKGFTFRAIGEVLGVNRTTAHQMYLQAKREEYKCLTYALTYIKLATIKMRYDRTTSNKHTTRG